MIFITAAASRALGYLRRHLRFPSCRLRTLTYETYVRPKLECASTICNLEQKYLIDQMKNIQSRAAGFLIWTYSRSVSITLIKESLFLTPLSSRRNVSAPCILHKIYKYHSTEMPFLERPYRTSRRLHNVHSLRHITGSASAFIHSAIPEIIRDWNDLPNHIVALTNPQTFREAVSLLLQTQNMHMQALFSAT